MPSAGPQFFAYPGQGELLRSQLWYSQSARIGDRIEISGQGGWSPQTGTLAPTPLEELDQAFSNVDLALRDAGGKGWEQVYKVRMYVVESMMDNEEFLGRAIVNLKKWMPGHQPLLTAVGVSKLGAGSSAGMKVEIEVEAWDPRG
ncbi:endoribonuclease L-PSP [Immersiella caudata]|uniref:Endoribonuclease L-PSP n=1 Tax=Immersiella caudata TaxID=314043 RepID=A0AA39XDA4_9PEZI|nr:endoribonuclease L-PSP [Immersiella caudata]